MKIHCGVSGCPITIEILDEVSPAIQYSCREHTQKGEDKLRFQELQFDPEIGSGTDPKSYEHARGAYSDQSVKMKVPGQTTRYIKKANQALEGHENKQEILDVLTEDTRCGNLGISKKE